VLTRASAAPRTNAPLQRQDLLVQDRGAVAGPERFAVHPQLAARDVQPSGAARCERVLDALGTVEEPARAPPRAPARPLALFRTA